MTNVWPVHDEDDHMKEGSGQLLGYKRRRTCVGWSENKST
jgi:hypothetical protein